MATLIDQSMSHVPILEEQPIQPKNYLLPKQSYDKTKSISAEMVWKMAMASLQQRQSILLFVYYSNEN